MSTPLNARFSWKLHKLLHSFMFAPSSATITVRQYSTGLRRFETVSGVYLISISYLSFALCLHFFTLSMPSTRVPSGELPSLAYLEGRPEWPPSFVSSTPKQDRTRRGDPACFSVRGPFSCRPSPWRELEIDVSGRLSSFLKNLIP